MNTGMLNGFAGINNNITQQTIADMQNANTINAGITNLGTQLQQCCCQNRYEDAQNFAQLNYNLADQECSTRRTVSDATHAAMFSYDIQLTYDQEELLADLLATYGQEIIDITNKIFSKIKNNRG